MSNIYAQAIDLVYYAQEDLLAAVAVEVAKSSPGTFLKAYANAQKIQSEADRDQLVRAHVINGDPIKAIKLYREIHGVSLGEAKRVVDVIRDEVSRNVNRQVNG